MHNTITFEKSYYSVDTDKTVTVQAHGDNLFDSIVYSSSDTSVATVDPVTGIVTGVKPGDVIITAESRNNPEVSAVTIVSVIGNEG